MIETTQAQRCIHAELISGSLGGTGVNLTFTQESDTLPVRRRFPALFSKHAKE